MNRSTLLAARDAWCDNPTTATQVYGPIANWDVSQIEDLSRVFCADPEILDCNPQCATFDENINSWNVANVKRMSYLFKGAAQFNSPLNSWTTSSLERLDHTFHQASAFNQPLSSWTVNHVYDMAYLFDSASAFNQDLNAWNTAQVEDMQLCFWKASSFNQQLSWDVQNVINFYEVMRTFSTRGAPMPPSVGKPAFDSCS